MSQISESVTLSYYGHCSFQWTTPLGIRVLIDPYGNREERRWFLREFPSVEADLLLMTHSHFDHDALERVRGDPTVLRNAGHFQISDLSVWGITDLHSSTWGGHGMANTIFTLEAGGVRTCHIGDNRADIPPEVRRAIGPVDVLMVTVDDSCHLLSYDEVDALVRLLKPLVVIPMHYYIPGLTTLESTLELPEGWLQRQQRVRRIGSDTVALSPEVMPAEREVWLMDPLLL